MIRWDTLRSNIVTGLLKDPDAARFTDEDMLIYARWACVEVSQHTAQADTLEFTPDGETRKFILPDDMIDSAEKSGLVYVSDGTNINYLDPLRLRANTVWPVSPDSASEIKGYWEWPSGVLTLGFTPSTSEKVGICYFKVWAPPLNDSDILQFPLFLEQPFSYFVAAYAMERLGVQASNIRQWNTKRDSGNPEDNPLHRQAEYFRKQAKILLDRNPTQDRETFYTVSR